MVASISPAASEVDETLGTPRFAQSVKRIKTVAVQNEDAVDKCDLISQTIS